MTGIWNVIVVQYNLLSTLAIDVGVAIYNTFTPSLPKGSVIPAGRPGHGGIWPPYEPPKEGYSRSPCPALNALANHGILPRDGKNIRFTEMSRKIHETYNFANTVRVYSHLSPYLLTVDQFCFVVPYYCANMLGRDYHRDTFNLADLALHNGIEHDASLCRVDTALCPNQADIHQPYIERLLASASGPNETLTRADVARQLSIRRAESRVENPEFSLALIHKAFGSIK
jgi:hypothetical protein